MSPIPHTSKRKRHNPERREFRGASYKKWGERIETLREAARTRDLRDDRLDSDESVPQPPEPEVA